MHAPKEKNFCYLYLKLRTTLSEVIRGNTNKTIALLIKPHAMKVYITHGGRLILALNGFEWSLHTLSTLTPKKYIPIPNEYDAVWVSLPVWRLRGREKSLVAARKRIPFLHSSCS
jgi:hypothetical protein